MTAKVTDLTPYLALFWRYCGVLRCIYLTLCSLVNQSNAHIRVNNANLCLISHCFGVIAVYMGASV